MTVDVEFAGDDLDDGLEYTFDDDVPESELVALPEDHSSDGSSGDERTTKVEQIKSKASGTKRKKHSNSDVQKKIKNDDYIDRKRNMATMEPYMIADLLASKIKHVNKDLSSLELNELLIPESRFVTTPEYTKERTLDAYPDFINKYLSKVVGQKSQNKLVVILSASALRVCEIARALRSVDGGAMKLINKNKLHHDKKIISSKKSSIAVSTPGRIKKLIAEGIISYEQISAIIVETTFLDVKMTNVWDIADNIPIIKEISEKSDSNIYLF